ncbi:alpha/beta hydrolase [Nocardioides marmoribigeumensis]|uniref:Acetyl esterase n=1 Tax=Nocardioides marmoribigeumensis TaxID=433649 RepID=A0ABU2BTH0_9ACTN|nr:alpha/beta hydrolase [Nocardioides marmoribigeumensis]MDR7361571.1 acetyl esterase [Nocardioides marmoribigeumensis]
MPDQPVDPHIAGLLQMIADSGYPPMHEGTPEDARKAFRAMTSDLVTDETRVPVASVEERRVPSGDGEQDARVYRPEGEGPFPTVLYLHGGGFVIGDLDTHDQTCRRIAKDCAAVVVAVDYRLAPEHPFPAAVEDCVAAARWAVDHLGELGGTDVLGVGGDSAGGNLAAVVSQTVRGLAAQLLFYPATDALGDYPSRHENAEGYFLELATMEWFFAAYAGDADLGDGPDPRHSPIQGELAGQPPAVVAVAGYDPLRDEGIAYAEALRAAGTEVELLRFDSLIHGFADMVFSPGADEAVGTTLARFSALLHSDRKDLS